MDTLAVDAIDVNTNDAVPEFLQQPALPVDWIDSDASLQQHCQAWAQASALALDTEFERVKTFTPILALVQVCDGKRIALIDAPAIKNWQPFAELLGNTRIEKIMHSAGEDVETLLDSVGAAPQPLCDTQVALALLNEATSLGYAPLVLQMFNVSLSKDSARTDWLARPLSDEQLRYAAADVLYLLPAFAQLKTRLLQQNRYDWLLQDGAAQAVRVQNPEPPQFAYRRLKQAFLLRGAQLSVARELCVLRDHIARTRNIPRTFVLRDEGLFSIAEKMPMHLQELSALDVLHPRALRVDGRAILDAIIRAAKEPKEQWPPLVKRVADLPAVKQALAQLQTLVQSVAEHNRVAPEWLLSKRQQELLLLNAVDALPFAPASWQGFRRQLLRVEVEKIILNLALTVPEWL